MEIICSFCKERTDIRITDGDRHMCRVCYTEDKVIEEYISPKLRKIIIESFDNQEGK